MSIASEDIDPVTLEVLWSRLRSIPAEMGMHFQRTAFSEIIKYVEDLSTVLVTWDGRVISQGVYEPAHLGSMLLSTKKILRDHFDPEDLEPGDVIVTNDPYIGAGHLPDLFTFDPIFYEDELVGFSVVTANYIDIGGSSPGSITVYADDIYEEGIQIPPVKLYEAGEPNEALVDTIVKNSRASEKVRGDLRAQLGASKVGADQYRELVAEYGFDTLRRYIEEIFERSGRSMRMAIEDLPDGTYAFEQQMDGFEEPLPLRAELTVDDDHLTVDWAGSADQVEYAINSTWNFTFAYSMYAIKTALDPNTPQNDGTISTIDVTAPDRSIVNAKLPAPVGARHILSNYIAGTINGALYQAIPGRIPSDAGVPCAAFSQITDPETGDQQILYDTAKGGGGAWHDRDGYPAISTATNAANTPIEVLEEQYAVRYHQYQQTQDTAGAGRHRGGSGTVREYEFLRPALVQSYTERMRFGPYGLAGGHAGSTAREILNPGTDAERELEPKSRFSVDAHDVLRIYTPGGGGYGDPTERDPESVLDDVENGVISTIAAVETYGIDPQAL